MTITFNKNPQTVTVNGQIPTGEKLVSEIHIGADEWTEAERNNDNPYAMITSLPVYSRPIEYEITVGKGWTVILNGQTFTEGQVIGRYSRKK